jgi:hypothetical protein
MCVKIENWRVNESWWFFLGSRAGHFEGLEVSVGPEWPNKWEETKGKTVEAEPIQADIFPYSRKQSSATKCCQFR